MHEWRIVGFEPQGCEYYDVTAICDFQHWATPLQDEDFAPQPLSSLRVHDINGTIPAGVTFSVFFLMRPFLNFVFLSLLFCMRLLYMDSFCNPPPHHYHQHEHNHHYKYSRK